MADVYEVVHPEVTFMDSATGGDEVLTSVRRKWVEGGGGDYAPELSATVGTITLPTAIYNGQKTVSSAGSAEALASSQAIVSGVHIKALVDNTDVVYVGNASVSSSNGLELESGDSVFIEIANLATVYVDVAVNGEGVSYIAT